MNTVKYAKNILITECSSDKKWMMLSDIHWDNPKCKRDTLKKHLDMAIEQDMGIVINGDFFCLMQGKWDPRRNKKDIRPEHNVHNYLDAVIEDAVDWWSPYMNNIAWIGYGNHETAIIKNTETDPLQRFVDLSNYKNKSKTVTGGYGGWWKLQLKYKSHSSHAFNVKYYHGTGGGGPVTKGVIQNNRMGVMVSGADCIWMGHVHELYHVIDGQESLDYSPKGGYKVKHKYVHHIRTAAYKEEYGYGDFGYHVEKGRPPKPIGGYILSFDYATESQDGSTASLLIPNFTQVRDH
jgi:UDP-2,3-diacylglucosamine pyrophosphatase LpxH